MLQGQIHHFVLSICLRPVLIEHKHLQENVERMFFDVTSARETWRFANLHPGMNTVWQVLALWGVMPATN
jgi:hypothetical protein